MATSSYSTAIFPIFNRWFEKSKSKERSARKFAALVWPRQFAHQNGSRIPSWFTP
jgi:hypothetical protein